MMNNNEVRETVVIPEKKEKIEKIKRKYKNMAMSDDTAKKIRRLEITNSILKTVTAIVGVVAFIDLVIPDPIPGLDEAILTGSTALLGSAVKIVNNKIEDLANTDQTELKIEEINLLSNQLNNVAAAVANKRAATK